MLYEWDEAKNRRNFAKHGLDFADAERVLTGPCLTLVDRRFDYGEARLISTPRGDETTRIIPMRKANRREQKLYQERHGEN